MFFWSSARPCASATPTYTYNKTNWACLHEIKYVDMYLQTSYVTCTASVCVYVVFKIIDSKCTTFLNIAPGVIIRYIYNRLYLIGND